MAYIYNPGSNADQLLQRKKDFYPSKLLSLADYNLPTDIKSIFRLCKYFALTSDIVGPAINKVAESPITELQYNHAKETVTDSYRELFEEQMKIRPKILGASFDLSVYGNSFLSLFQKKTRYLVCPTCKSKKGDKARRHKIESLDWKLVKLDLVGVCPTCKNKVKFLREEKDYKSVKNLRIIRWDPMRIEIDYIPLIDKKVYYYNLSNVEYRRIISGDREYICDIPWDFVVAAKENRKIKINPENLFHFYTVTISNAYDGWGIPRMLNVFKSLFYLQTLLRANEAISRGRINDLTVFYPEINRKGTGPIETIGGSKWREELERILYNHEKDPNYVGVTAFPVGYQQIFGNGRQLLITSEMEIVIRNILAGMGVTTDIIYSGSTYTSMAVANRMLANQLNLSRAKIDEFLRFLVSRVNAMNPEKFPKISVNLSEYETVDDMQETGYLVQLLLNKKIPLATVLRRFKLKYDEELSKLKKETEDFGPLEEKWSKSMAYGQGEAGMVAATYQRRQQEVLMQPQMTNGAVAGNGLGSPAPKNNMESLAVEVAQKLLELPPEDREIELERIAEDNPTLASYVQQVLINLIASYGEPTNQQETFTEDEDMAEPVVEGSNTSGLVADAAGGTRERMRPPRGEGGL